MKKLLAAALLCLALCSCAPKEEAAGSAAGAVTIDAAVGGAGRAIKK